MFPSALILNSNKLPDKPYIKSNEKQIAEVFIIIKTF